ncbi:MAG TPA: hypothetical protein VLL47_07635, partial [Robiginitalea sp.]|nr:hypothetical protein [Robiginitalea sp.]
MSEEENKELQADAGGKNLQETEELKDGASAGEMPEPDGGPEMEKAPPEEPEKETEPAAAQEAVQEEPEKETEPA